VASVTLSIPLAFEILEPNAMRRAPRPADEPVFSRFILYRLIMVAMLMTAGGCALFLWEYYRIVGDLPLTAARHAMALSEAQTLCVTVVTFSQIFYLLNCRSLRDSIFSLGVMSNPSVFAGIGILLILQLCFMYLPQFRTLFGSAPLDMNAWLTALLAGAMVLPVISLEKWIRKKKGW